MAEFLVLGGGLAGLRAALEFRLRGEEVKLIDSSQKHEFKPGTIEILRGRVDRDKLEKDIEKSLRGTGIDFCNEKVERINPEKSKVETSKNTYSYDKLVVALGSEARRNGYGISSFNHVYTISAAAQLRDSVKKNSHIAVLGGGYVGLEVAGEFAETENDVTFITSGEKPIPHTNQRAADLAVEYLERKNVRLKSEKELESVSHKKLNLKNGETVEPDIVVWCRGRKTPEVVGDDFGLDDKTKGIEVKSDSEKCSSYPAKNYEDIYVAGDCANTYWKINSQDSISIGKTAIFFTGELAFRSRIFRYLKDVIRRKHFLYLKTKKMADNTTEMAE